MAVTAAPLSVKEMGGGFGGSAAAAWKALLPALTRDATHQQTSGFCAGLF
jgi:hypothetical protein